MLSVHYMSEFMTGAISGKIMERKFTDILSKRFRNAQEIELFQEILLSDVGSIKEAIDTGAKSFEDFLVILNKADKFRSWLRELHPNEQLLKEYFIEATKDSWIDTLPTKMLKFVITTAVGLVEPITGTTISAADSFLLNRFAEGWRPNKFIKDELYPFLSN